MHGMKMGIDLEDKRILVIDDEMAIANLLKIILEKEKCIVDIASNGKVGLEKINNFDYDLILCDMKMPLMSGEEFYNIVSKEKPKLVKKIVYITGNTIGHNNLSFLEKTGAEFLRKPFFPDEVRELVGNFFEKDRG